MSVRKVGVGMSRDRKEYMHQYYLAHKEKMNAKQKKWQKEHAEEVRKRANERYYRMTEEEKEKRREYYRKYAEEHREKINEQARERYHKLAEEEKKKRNTVSREYMKNYQGKKQAAVKHRESKETKLKRAVLAKFGY